MRLSGQFQASSLFFHENFRAKKKAPKGKTNYFPLLEVFVCAKNVAFVV